MTLAELNVLYRRPDLYDALAGQGDTKSDSVRRLVARYGLPRAHTLLDLGCGTGFDLVDLGTSYDCVGIDLQEHMIAYGHRVRPDLDLQVGDLRTVRLGSTFDILTCLGNTLTYLMDDPAREQAFATFAAHAHQGTVLLIQTIISPVLPSHEQLTTVNHGHLRADVTTTIEWRPATDSSIMHRRWVFDDGEEAIDRIERRVTRPAGLEQLMVDAGFQLLDITGEPTDEPPNAPKGPAAWVVGRYTTSAPPLLST